MNESQTRLSITYAKTGVLRYTGLLDMQRLWERLVRRAQLPVVYSQGFHPQARIQQACALPLGFTSTCEILDIWLENSYLTSEIARSIQSTAPPGIEIKHLEEVDLHMPALQTLVVSSEYLAELLEPIDIADLTTRVSNLNSATTLIRTRREKAYDLRPLIEDLKVIGGKQTDYPKLFMRMAAREGATGRPEEVMASLEYPALNTRIERTRLILRQTIHQNFHKFDIN